ncbi:MAG: hypothetical protein E7356_05085 [Clostridiales bacterium]|nr:hypothetical protein [Clostridiales bacterium]
MLFGTDGVRGIVDKDINPEIAYNIGKGFAMYLKENKVSGKVLIGCDTRISSDTYMYAVACGVANYNFDVDIVGIIPTPGISYLVLNNKEYIGGVMITASHNDSTYNGIKIFNSYGEKTSKDVEDKIENNIAKEACNCINKGKIRYDEQILTSYIKNLITTFENRISKVKIVIDSANGSNYAIAPYVYRTLGAEVIEINCNNDGVNINNNCGANHIEQLQQTVLKSKADIGIAFDGDGDRLRVVLSDGKVISGDDILLALALNFKKKNRLNNLLVAGTIMTNGGTENALRNHGIKLMRSDVGDKNLVMLMKDNGIAIGGESSGHICIYNYIRSCDALYNSLEFVSCLLEDDVELLNIINSNFVIPSVTKNVVISDEFRKTFNTNINVDRDIINIKKQYPDSRIIVRPSGTESVIRIYVEGTDCVVNQEIVEKIEKILVNYQL